MKATAQNLKSLSDEELILRRNKLRGAYLGMGIVLLFALSILVYLIISKELYTLLAVVCATPLTLLPGLITISNVNKEIKERGIAQKL